MITTLIDKQDSFEIVRDQLAIILAVESTNQQKLAAENSKDSELWKLRVFTERSNPWEAWLNDEDPDPTPIVNIWFDTDTTEGKASNPVSRQKTTGTFNIDCYGYGKSRDDITTAGHFPGDEAANKEAQRALRLVRNILLAGEYTYLGLQGLVWGRGVQSRQTFQPEIQGRTTQHIVGARLVLQVGYNETSPQVEGNPLELISIDILRQETGEILAEADYVYPL